MVQPGRSPRSTPDYRRSTPIFPHSMHCALSILTSVLPYSLAFVRLADCRSIFPGSHNSHVLKLLPNQLPQLALLTSSAKRKPGLIPVSRTFSNRQETKEFVGGLAPPAVTFPYLLDRLFS